MHKILILFYLTNITFLQASNLDSIPPLDTLIHSLEHYHQSELKAELAQFQIAEKGSWLKYIPSIGVGYNLGLDENGNLKNVLRPSLSYSTNVIYQVRQDKEQRRAQIETIRQKAALALEKEKLKLELLYKKYQNGMAELTFRQELHKIDTELYAIATAQFAATEIAPSVYLPQKRNYLKKEFELFQSKQLIQQLQSEILVLAHSSSK